MVKELHLPFLPLITQHIITVHGLLYWRIAVAALAQVIQSKEFLDASLASLREEAFLHSLLPCMAWGLQLGTTEVSVVQTV